MVATALPDVAAATKVYLGLSSAITALAGTRIWLEWPYADLEVPPALTAVMIEAGKGGPGERDGGRIAERIDITCFGADRRTANLLWRTVHYYLCPPEGSGRENGFEAARTHVYEVIQESGPLRDVDPDSHWPFCRGSYIFDYHQEPTS